MNDVAPDARLRRLGIRSWRRGIREMDLILGKWSDAWLARLDDDELEIYEALLNESDHDLYQWVTGQQAAPEAYRAMIARIAANAAPS